MQHFLLIGLLTLTFYANSSPTDTPKVCIFEEKRFAFSEKSCKNITKGTILKDIQPVEAALYCDEPIIITELVTCPYNGRKIVSPEDVTDYQHHINILTGKE